MGHSAHATAHVACPTNQRVGLEVDTLTVRALLAIPLTAVSPAEVYWFCPTPDCPTVYYRVDGQQVFVESELRERVYQKHSDDRATTICYCFGHTLSDISAEIEQTGTSTVVARISTGIRAGQCACDIRNPQGGCCLGNVHREVQRLTRQAAAIRNA